jgi:hypothetical protein
MAWPRDNTSITHSIQLAVAPVFLLTAVAGMIGAVAGRLARIIDWGRQLEARALASGDAEFLALAAASCSASCASCWRSCASSPKRCWPPRC